MSSQVSGESLELGHVEMLVLAVFKPGVFLIRQAVEHKDAEITAMPLAAPSRKERRGYVVSEGSPRHRF